MARPPTYDCDETFFKNIDSHEKAYLLGFLWADGHNNPRSGLRIILHKQDEEILLYFKNYMKCNSPIKYRDDYCIFSINRKNIYNDLLNLGMFTNKSKNNLIWPEISSIYINSFILGVFDGDGSIWNKEGSYAASFANGFSFLCELKTHLMDNGIMSNPIRYRYGIEKPQACQLDISGYDNIIKLKDFLYSDSVIFMSRKFNKFCEADLKFSLYKVTNKRLNGTRDEIYSMYSSGIRQSDISKQLNIKYSTVRAIIQRGRRNNQVI